MTGWPPPGGSTARRDIRPQIATIEHGETQGAEIRELLAADG